MATSALRKMWDGAARLIVPLAALGVCVGIFVGLILLASWDEDHVAIWAQVISAASLLLITVLLFATGTKGRVVIQDIKDGDAIKFGRGKRLTQSEFDGLSVADKEKVHSQRGLSFRSLYAGDDGRWSTSKLQALLWTFAIGFALTALFVADRLGLRLEGDSGFAGIPFQQEYLLLLGGPFAAAVLAKGIMTTKIDEGSVAKVEVPADRGAVTGLRDVISDDAGRVDLVDFQYFLFNLIALAFFLFNFVDDLAEGFPPLPEFLVGLTSASALAYVTKKAVERKVPSIAQLVPSSAFAGETVELSGRYLVGPAGQKPTVTVDGRPGSSEVVRFETETASIRVQLPEELAPGSGKTLAVTPPDATTPATTELNVLSVAIDGTQPSTVSSQSATSLTIEGKEFGAAEGEAVLGGKRLTIGRWTVDKIHAVVPIGLGPNIHTLVVTRKDRKGSGSHDVTVT